MEEQSLGVDGKTKELEKKVFADYSRDNVQSHLEFFSSLTRRPGTDDELRAAKYIKGKLDEYGVDAEIFEFDAYVGQVGKSTLDILSPIQRSFLCEPRGFTAQTPADGVEGELVSLGKGLEKDYEGVDVAGKIVLIEPGGLAAVRMPASQLAEKKGAVAQIHIATGKTREIHMGQIRYTWGNPTPDTIDKIPHNPLISVCNEDGKYLVSLTREAPVVARINTHACRSGYVRVRQPVGTLKGAKEPEKFVLFGGHYCSWYKGATDNAVSNSMMLEMARIFARHRKEISRGIRFAWWTCHEQGTYAGSTWYADNFWEDIRDNAVAYLVVDGLGRGSAAGFVPDIIEARNTEDIRKFNETVLKEIFGLEVTSKKLNKSGDQSFWGIGVPSFFGKPSFKARKASAEGDEEVWYSHTAEDTLDKVDLEDMFNIPFKYTVASILRLCNNPVLPFEFVTMAKAFEKRLQELQQAGNMILDFTSLLVQAEAFKKKAEDLSRAIDDNLSAFEKQKSDAGLEGKFRAINECLVKLSRVMNPILYTKSGKYGQDSIGSNFKSIPSLQPLEGLDDLDESSEEYKAWHTCLVRERNKVSDTLKSANWILDNTLKIL